MLTAGATYSDDMIGGLAKEDAEAYLHEVWNEAAIKSSQSSLSHNHPEFARHGPMLILHLRGDE